MFRGKVLYLHIINQLKQLPMSRLKLALISLTSFSIAVLIMAGIPQQYIHFAGPENEMGCFFIAFLMGGVTLYGACTPDEKPSIR